MTQGSWALSGDLPRGLAWAAVVFALVGIALLVVELRRSRKPRALGIAASGIVAVVLLVVAVLRPVAIASRGSLVGPKVIVLLDRSRSMELPGEEGSRFETARRALERLGEAAKDARITWMGFGEGAPAPIEPGSIGDPVAHRSDLGAALSAVAQAPDERPQAIVVLSDGRLDRPGEEATGAAVEAALGSLDVPVHAVSVAGTPPKDASIRSVRTAQAAVAHQPFPVTVEIGCDGGLACGNVGITARELLETGPPNLLASGMARVENGKAKVELSLTLDRAGSRIVEIAIDAPEGDAIPDNDRRFVTFDVARDRVRILHVAGRPTYDVRALRTFLKSDASIDVVAFFILRTRESDVNAAERDLALIEFPVHELFTEHLPSFDAVILQDFDAAPYQLLQHLPNLAEYVRKGGGLVMVGGPGAFGGGNYAGTSLGRVLPIELGTQESRTPFDLGSFVPSYTELGRAIPVLRPLRNLLGDALPEMPGTNRLGDARPGSFVLWSHPRLTTASGAPMPVLALREEGNGRSVALALDGSHRLAYGTLASEAAGRAHGALWEGLLGWLMRDPRYEPAQVELRGPCAAGRPLELEVRPLPMGTPETARVEVIRLGDPNPLVEREVEMPQRPGEPAIVDVGSLEPGGYTARVRLGEGPATRRDFACERGGDEWADSRPDVARLRAIANATGGEVVSAADAGKLSLPPATEVSAERHVAPLLPPWVLTSFAALALSGHWILRRRAGLA